jgi:hypothetical protein
LPQDLEICVSTGVCLIGECFDSSEKSRKSEAFATFLRAIIAEPTDKVSDVLGGSDALWGKSWGKPMIFQAKKARGVFLKERSAPKPSFRVGGRASLANTTKKIAARTSLDRIKRRTAAAVILTLG